MEHEFGVDALRCRRKRERGSGVGRPSSFTVLYTIEHPFPSQRIMLTCSDAELSCSVISLRMP